MSRIRRALRATAVAQVFNVAAMLLSLLAIPFYLQWLGQERYGLLLTALSISGYLMFADAGLSWASMILIAQAHGMGDSAHVAAIMRTSMFLSICSAVLVLVIALVLTWTLSQGPHIAWLPTHPEVAGLVFAVGCSAAITLLCAPSYNLWIGLQEADRAAMYQGIGRIAGTCATLAAAFAGAPLAWILGSAAVCTAAVGTASALHCRSRHGWAFAPGSYWDRDLVTQQLRTGAKSFAMQVGTVLSGTAPVLAISMVSGPANVPIFSVPMTLLNAPLGTLSTLNANLQAGFADAYARGEQTWITSTLRRLLFNCMAVSVLVVVGFLFLARPFIEAWTSGRLLIPVPMLWSVALIVVPATLWSGFRFFLTGINRHREAAAGEILFGVLAMILGMSAVNILGFQWIGFGVVLAFAVTTCWLLPWLVRRSLRANESIFPDWRSITRLGWVAMGTAACGWRVVVATAGIEPVIAIGVTTLGIAIPFAILMHAFFGPQWWRTFRIGS